MELGDTVSLTVTVQNFTHCSPTGMKMYQKMSIVVLLYPNNTQNMKLVTA